MVDKHSILKESEHLLSSFPFRNKPQIQRLLSYLIEHSFDDKDSAYDQRAIALECLGRCADFDPSDNPVVRIEVGRLRKLLNQFYSTESSRSFVISIPLGQYRPIISRNLSNVKFIPQLIASPAEPESLTLLLQFDTGDDEGGDLYLLRHQIRIGLTVYIGKIKGVRLLVALPDEKGNVASHVDFIVRVSIRPVTNAYQLLFSTNTKANNTSLNSQSFSLPSKYNDQQLGRLINHCGADLLDREIGVLWKEWLSLRSNAGDVRSPRLNALIAYQHYLLNDTKVNLEIAFSALCEVKDDYFDDSVIHIALAELYYRMSINGWNVVADPVQEGLLQVRSALRSNASCVKLHMLLAFMLFFSQDYKMAEVELSLCKESHQYTTHSYQFHLMVLSCLVSGFEEGLDHLKVLCDRIGVYPRLYSVMLYLNSMLTKNYDLADVLFESLDKDDALSAVLSCANFTVLPSSWSFEGSRDKLRNDLLHHFSQVS